MSEAKHTAALDRYRKHLGAESSGRPGTSCYIEPTPAGGLIFSWEKFNRDAHTLAAAFCASHAELVAVLEDLLPYAEQSIKRLNEQMVGNLYPSINAAKLFRAEAALALARGGA